MFFRRNEGQYHETDREHALNWLSQGSTGFVRRRRILVFSRCLRGCGCTVCCCPSGRGGCLFSGQTLLRGALATGGLAFVVSVVTQVAHADEMTDQPILESEAGAKTDLLAASDSVVLGKYGVCPVSESQVNSQESSETTSSQTSEASLSESFITQPVRCLLLN